VYLSKKVASFSTLELVVNEAHRQGLSVFLFPILCIDDVRPGKWRGTIQPWDWGRWFQSYGYVIKLFAKFAEKSRIELLLVGCELVSTEKKDDFWIKLIEKVRSVYSGKLIYSSNWDNLSKSDFIKKLDFIGSNGYFTLSDTNRPTKEQLLRKWREIQKKYKKWQKKYDKPFIFTEIGFPSTDGGNQAPWDYTTFRAPDVKEQDLCFESFFEMWHDEPYLNGVFIYNWWGEGGMEDTSYTPRKKPAEETIRKWFLKY